jgi:hypothetical protein
VEDFVDFIFGKYLKIILLIAGFLACVTYGNHPSHVGYAIIGAILLFSSVYLSVHEKKK